VQGCSEDELAQLIHEGGLITKLKGCVNKKNPCRGQEGPAAAIDALTALWTKKAAEVSRELYTRIEGGCTACCAGTVALMDPFRKGKKCVNRAIPVVSQGQSQCYRSIDAGSSRAAGN
jgi:hypothetical protein